MAENLIGQTIGRYQIIAELGEGGMATVYKAFDTRLERDVAIKVIRTSAIAADLHAQMLARFEREAKSMAKLQHPHIVKVHDFGEYHGAPYLVMEHLSGGTLKNYMGKPFSVDKATRFLLSIAQALAYAHEKGVVHRDVKPANILLTEKGQPMLSDFGIVRLLGDDEMTGLTGTGVGIGTPGYMAPEQWTGNAGPPSDIYALGVVLYEMVTGRKPYTASTPVAILAKQLTEALPSPRLYVAGLSQQTEQVMVTALAKDVGQRYASMDKFTQALEGLLSPTPSGGGVVATPPVNQQSAGEPGVAATQSNEMRLPLARGVEMAFVRIPAGEFWMGSDRAKDALAKDNELPQHKVYLDEYWIGKYPVTVAQFSAFVKSTGYRCNASSDLQNKANHPVVSVRWDDAAAFCAWAARVAGQKVHLPSEAQWEKAARGIDARIYPWGNKAPDPQLCNFNRHENGLTPIGQYSPQGDSPYGCADMAGNVCEMVADWYDGGYYGQSPRENPTGPSSGQYRVLRGGSWNFDDDLVRTAFRSRYDPTNTYSSLGVRCAALL